MSHVLLLWKGLSFVSGCVDTRIASCQPFRPQLYTCTPWSQQISSRSGFASPGTSGSWAALQLRTTPTGLVRLVHGGEVLSPSGVCFWVRSQPSGSCSALAAVTGLCCLVGIVRLGPAATHPDRAFTAFLLSLLSLVASSPSHRVIPELRLLPETGPA